MAPGSRWRNSWPTCALSFSCSAVRTLGGAGLTPAMHDGPTAAGRAVTDPRTAALGLSARPGSAAGSSCMPTSVASSSDARCFLQAVPFPSALSHARWWTRDELRRMRKFERSRRRKNSGYAVHLNRAGSRRESCGRPREGQSLGWPLRGGARRVPDFALGLLRR